MKKILIFSLAYYPNYVSGAEAAIKEITSRISPEEIEFHLITLRYDSALPHIEKIGNVLVYRIGITKLHPSRDDLKKLPLDLNKPLFQFEAVWKAWRLHRKNHYDSIWAMMAHSAGVPAALFKLLNPSVPYVLTLQEGDPPEKIERTMRPLWPLFTRAFTLADRVQVISAFLGEWAKKRGVVNPIELIRNGANPNDLADNVSAETVERIQNRIGKQKGDIILTNTARLVHQKGFDTVIRALPLLPDHVKFLIVGGGPEEEMLRSLVDDLDLEKRVMFTGQVDRNEVTNYRRAADIFVGPSRSEGLGNAFLSAMASRLPVVTTQVGGLADFVFDEKRNPGVPSTAWAVDADNPEQLAEAVKEILAHPEKVKETTERARAMVLENYDWDHIAKQMEEKIFTPVLEKTS